MKVDLKNDELYNNKEFAPVVVAGDDQPGLPPAVIYATANKARDTPTSMTSNTDRTDKSHKSRKSDEIEFFNPEEFDTDRNISRDPSLDGDSIKVDTLKSYYDNSTYDYDYDDEDDDDVKEYEDDIEKESDSVSETDVENQPSFLI